MKKNMIRKILSLIMALSVSAAAISAFAEEADTSAEAEAAVEEVNNTESNEESEVVEKERTMTKEEMDVLSRLNFLQCLGIMTDYSADDIMANETVTRAEYVKNLANMYNGKVTGGICNYNDVKSSDNYYEALGILTALGIIHGDENKNFNPNDNIKNVDMIKTAVLMLDYDIFVKNKDGDYNGYMNIASEKGLAKGLNFSDEARFNDVVGLLYRILDSKVVGIDINENQMELLDETFIEHWFDAFEGEGYVSANEYSGVVGTNAVSNGEVKIDGVTYDDKYHIAAEYIGCNIEFWYIDDEVDGKYIIWAEPDNGVTVLTIPSEDLENATTYSLEYIVNNRTKTIRLSEDVTVIYNGVEYSGFTADFFKGIDGEFIAVSNKNASEYDTLVIKDYEYYIVDKVDAEKHIVKDKFGRILEAELDDEADDVIWRDLNGYVYDIEYLQEYDVLAVQKDMNEDTYFKITVFQNCTEGRITGWGHEDGSQYVYLDGTDYKISDNYFDIAHDKYPVNEGSYADAFVILDLNGNIIMLEASSEDQYKMGVLVKFLYDDIEELMYAKIFESSSDYTTYPVSKKLKVDGIPVTKNDEFSSAIKMLQKGDVIRYTASGEATAPADANFVYQVMRYTVNKDGEIDKIDTAAEDPNYPTEQLINVLNVNTETERGKKLTYKSSGNAFNKAITVGSTNTWHLPAPADYENTEAYKIEKSSFSNDESYSIIPYATAYSKMNTPDVLVLVNQRKTSLGAGNIYMFEDMATVVDEDEDVVTRVHAWHKGKQNTLTATNASLFAGFKKGDLFACEQDAKGETIRVRQLFDLENEKIYSLDNDSKTELANPNIACATKGYRFIYADVYDRSGETFRLASVFNPAIGSDGLYGFNLVPANQVGKKDLLEIHQMNLFRYSHGCMVYNVYDGTIKEATADDLRSYKSEGNRCSKAFAITSIGESTHLFIYNFEE